MKKTPPTKNKTPGELPDIPQQELKSLARRLLPAIREYFESEEGKKEFDKWKKQKEREKVMQ